ncbi:ABC transporter permease [Dyadobacter psychrophilus]|uniref:ABC-type antimicrobial peptide transport system, permease component n=1 Tax=Dyadobacter psychrophilus TaxID=651661 RepID=A0A1T5H862_9BACT|nr:ABC transporter permease [Dyadobacter psychrophilus]SKC16731.1 ABC-type antimicrobial peptide transport system, permease component [Dyadobacter psychrophilus]
MFRNHIKIALRNLIKNKGYSAINIGGLAVGMAVAMLIGLWIYDELSFNKNHDNYASIVKVFQNQTFNGNVETSSNVPLQLEAELRNTHGSNFKYIVTAGFPSEHLLTFGEKKIIKVGNYIGAEIAEMLTLKMIRGTRAGLIEPNSIMLSESTAKAVFGNVDALDKIVKLDNKEALKVTGVYADLPDNSTFQQLNFITPWTLLKKDLPKWLGWGNNWFQVFAQVAQNNDIEAVSAKIANAKLKNIDAEEAKYKPEMFLLPMSRWNLYSEFKNGVNAGGRIEYVWLFGVIGVFVLLLACINFMNLSTARSEKRAKEVGLRKAIGSMKAQLVMQFFGESFLVVAIAFLLSLILAQLSLSQFNEVVAKKVAIPWASPVFWLASISFILLTSFIAGSYPALYLSSFRPIEALKGVSSRLGRMAVAPRKVLVVIQFTISITLIIGTMIVYRQVQFAKSRPIGYNRGNVISSPIKSDQILNHFATFREELINMGAVEELAATDTPVTNTTVTNGGFNWKGKDPGMAEEFVTLRVTHEFGKTMDWQIIEGRDFSKDIVSDSMGFILNEAAVKYMGLKDPINETIHWGDNEQYKVIGVVKDMVTQSPYEPAKQTIFFINYKRVSLVNMKLKPAVSASEALAKIERVFKKFDPENPFQYTFMNDEYARKFNDEERTGKLVTFFAVLAIFISCLGLFGLASFTAEQRTKEIGIRKVLGASVANLWQMLSQDFVLLITISCLVAGPISFYFMTSWLQKFTYRTEISWWIFALAAAGALTLTLFTVSYQAIKAALMDPVKSLKSD